MHRFRNWPRLLKLSWDTTSLLSRLVTCLMRKPGVTMLWLPTDSSSWMRETFLASNGSCCVVPWLFSFTKSPSHSLRAAIWWPAIMLLFIRRGETRLVEKFLFFKRGMGRGSVIPRELTKLWGSTGSWSMEPIWIWEVYIPAPLT